MEVGRAHQSLQDLRPAIKKPEAVSRHSEESQRRIARTCVSQAPAYRAFLRAFSEWSREHLIICLGRMTAPFKGFVQTDKRPETFNQTLSFSSPTKMRTLSSYRLNEVKEIRTLVHYPYSYLKKFSLVA